MDEQILPDYQGPVRRKFHRMSDIMAMPVRQRRDLVRNRIERAKVTLFCSEGGVGKSTIATELHHALSYGRPSCLFGEFPYFGPQHSL